MNLLTSMIHIQKNKALRNPCTSFRRGNTAPCWPLNGPFIRYAKLRLVHGPGMPGMFPPPPPLVSDPGMHHGTCVTDVPWCMSKSHTHVGGENVPGIPGACATRNCSYLVRGPYGVCHLCYKCHPDINNQTMQVCATDIKQTGGFCIRHLISIL